MEHKTEVDLPFTVGSTTASLTQMQSLAAETERKTQTCTNTFSMNSNAYFFFFQIYYSVFIFLVENK